MGGSGGSYHYVSSQKLRDKIQESKDKTKQKEEEAKISELLDIILKKINERDTNAVKKHIDEIIKALGKEIEGTLSSLFGGSVGKHTYVDGLSDIDALVLVDNSELQDQSPEKVKDYFLERLKGRFPNTPMEKGKLAITLKFEDIEIQLLPAIKVGNNYKITDHTGNNWSVIKPKEFTERLSQTNQDNGSKIIPTIKLVKSILAQSSPKKQLTGYHTEALALEIFKDYKGPYTNKAMVEKFFSEGSQYVLHPIVDKTGQSPKVDEYLGKESSLGRKIVSDELNRIARKLKNASETGQVEHWKELLGWE